VDDGAITETFDKNWPMMHGHLTAHTVDGLDATTRDQLLHLLQEAQGADQHEALITAIKQRLAAHPQELDGRAPRWVIFRTEEWDNGHFLTGSEASVYFADGDHVPFDFWGSSVDDILTDMYGARGSNAALGVDLREDMLEFDDYGDNMPGMLGIPPEHRDGDGCAIPCHRLQQSSVTQRTCPSPTSVRATFLSPTTTSRSARRTLATTATTAT
jgi:hypothetical protein